MFAIHSAQIIHPTVKIMKKKKKKKKDKVRIHLPNVARRNLDEMTSR